MTPTFLGFYWNYNVHKDGVPIKSMGRVFYVIDDFGNMKMVTRGSLTVSLS